MIGMLVCFLTMRLGILAFVLVAGCGSSSSFGNPVDDLPVQDAAVETGAEAAAPTRETSVSDVAVTQDVAAVQEAAAETLVPDAAVETSVQPETSVAEAGADVVQETAPDAAQEAEVAADTAVWRQPGELCDEAHPCSPDRSCLQEGGSGTPFRCPALTNERCGSLSPLSPFCTGSLSCVSKAFAEEIQTCLQTCWTDRECEGGRTCRTHTYAPRTGRVCMNDEEWANR